MSDHSGVKEFAWPAAEAVNSHELHWTAELLGPDVESLFSAIEDGVIVSHHAYADRMETLGHPRALLPVPPSARTHSYILEEGT
jgi:hypothetical protein